MLKIKDNVDLKELEKFGFVEAKYMILADTPYYEFAIDVFDDGYSSCIIIKENREILFVSGVMYNGQYEIEPNILYDLIKADLVEKVELQNERT